MVGHARVQRRDAGHVDDDHLGAVGADAPQELLGELAGALRVDEADHREDEQALADLEHRSRQEPDGLLLLADDALALLHEPDRHGDRDAVRGGLVGVEHAVQHAHVAVVLREQRAGQHVAEQEHDADDLVGLDAARE